MATHEERRAQRDIARQHQLVEDEVKRERQRQQRLLQEQAQEQQEQQEQQEPQEQVQEQVNMADAIVKEIAKKSLVPVDDPKKVKSWVFAMENAFGILEIPDPQRVTLALNFLQGRLGKFAEQYAADHADAAARTFAQFKASLLNQYGDQHAVREARQQLVRVTQRGSVKSFAQHFRELLLTGNVAANNPLAVHAFVAGLKDDRVRTQVALKACDTLDAAIQAATDVEGAARPFSSRTTSRRSAPPSTARREGSFQRSRPPPRDAKRSDSLKCFNCGRPGHRASECRSPSKPVSAQEMLVEDEDHLDPSFSDSCAEDEIPIQAVQDFGKAW